MKKYTHKNTDNVATSIGYTNYYMTNPLKETVHKSLVENSNDWELFTPTVEVGKVYKSNNKNSKTLLLVKEVKFLNDNNVEIVKGNGFNHSGKWFSFFEDVVTCSTCLIEATEYEWFERLEEEAIKRGLVKGVKFNSAWSFNSFEIDGFKLIKLNLMSEKGCLMDSETGKWATPIIEKKPILITKDGVDCFENDVVYGVALQASGNDRLIKKKLPFNFRDITNRFWFKDENKAKEYIELNEKKYSLNDVMKVGGFTYHIEKLKKLNK